MSLKDTLSQLKEKGPLVHAITNHVTINDCANITLAVGASPAMCESTEEVYDFVSIANALYINIGTLTKEQKESMYIAAERASELGVPILLDPVGVVALKNRQALVKDLLTKYNITCLNGNISEIKCLAGQAAAAKGVDSLDKGEGIEQAAQELSNKYNTIVLASGKQDCITKEGKTFWVNNGTPLLGRITGSGCMLGILTAAFLSALKDDHLACLAGAVTMGLAGELAAKDLLSAADLGTFRLKLFDQMAALTEEGLLKYANYK